MLHNRKLTAFFCRCALLFGVLIFPWPGMSRIYGRYIIALGQGVFGKERGKRILIFERGPKDPRLPINTQITMVNRDQIRTDGQAPVLKLYFDSRQVCLLPTILVITLICASPTPWSRRLPALCAGVILVHCFFLFSIAVFIWDHSTELSLLNVSPFWKTLLSDADCILMDRMGAGFIAPVLIWIAVTFRRQDLVFAEG